MISVIEIHSGSAHEKRFSIPLCYGTHKMVFGRAIFAWADDALCALEYIGNERGGVDAARQRVARRWPECELKRDLSITEKVLGEFLKKWPMTGNRKLKIMLKGTPFQCAVWRELLKIPLGQTVAYSAIARAVGSPKAVRAVGAAVGCNPISLVVPCHRVVRSDGGIGGYAGGLPLKRKILRKEGVNF